MKKSIAKNYTYNLIYQILVLILPLVTTPYLSRVLGAEGIGIYSYTLSIVTYFILFGSLGLAMYGQREIAYVQSDEKEKSKVFFEIFILKASTLLISMIIFYFTYAIDGQYQMYYKIFMGEIIANIIDISWFFQGIEEFKKTVTRNIFVKLLSLVLIFTLVKTPADLGKYIFIYVFSTLLANLSLWFYIPKYIKRVQLRKINVKRHIKGSILLFIPQIAVQIYTVLDKTMLGTMVTDIAEVGFYEQAQKIVKMSLAIVTAFGTVMSPRIANTFINNDKKLLDEYIKRSFRFVWFLGIPIMFGLIGIAKNFVPWFYGEGFEKVELLIIVCSPIIISIGLNNVSGIQYLVQVKKQNIFTITVVIGAIANFVLNLILIHYFKAVGAIISSVLAETIILIVQLIYTRKEIRLSFVFEHSLIYILAGIIMCLVVYCIGTFLSFSMISTFIQIAIGGVTYIGILLICKDEFLLSNIKKVLNKLKRKDKSYENKN